MKRPTQILSLITLSLLVSQLGYAADTKKKVDSKAAPATTANETIGDSLGGAEQVNIDKIKEKYWARGDESEMGVVQNRTYSKEHKFEFGVFGGLVFTDPFLSVQSLGFSGAYHFSEYFSLGAVYWKDFVSPSSAVSAAQDSIQSQAGVPFIAPTNRPNYYVGIEPTWSVLYGKLSVLGQAIIYYDMHLLGGVGMTNTESGSNFTGDIGIGQQVYLSKRISIRFDYRLLIYSETLLEKVKPATLGQPVGNRTNSTNSFMLGVDFLIGSMK